MDEPGHTSQLTHQDCLELIGSLPRSHTARITVDGGDPVVLACFVVPGGDVLVPTGNDPGLTRLAVGRPVHVEFSGDRGTWTVHGVGLARPLEREHRPRSISALAMRYAFDNGILVRMARLSGLLAATPDVPAQRDASAEPDAYAVPNVVRPEPTR